LANCWLFPYVPKSYQQILDMTDSTIRDLRRQNKQLRKLTLSLSAALLRKVVTESEMQRACSRADAERFVHEAEECFRCARIPGLKQEVAKGLDVAGHELMAIAVDIDTKLQRLRRT
jgi:hypothetical protein